MRYLSADNFVGRPIDGYEAERCYITAEAARALGKVQHELAHVGLSLKVFDAYRPQRAVDHFVRWAEDLDDRKMKAAYYPDVEKQHLFRDGTRDPDLTIVATGPDGAEELDMGTPWDFFGPRSWPLSREVTPQQRANRMLLQTLMIKHGFLPLAEEWWHFRLEEEPFPDTPLSHRCAGLWCNRGLQAILSSISGMSNGGARMTSSGLSAARRAARVGRVTTRSRISASFIAAW